jgi:hypothetical protein
MTRRAAPPSPAVQAARRDPWLWILAALALANGLNALWMLAAPEHWYHELPANVPAAGPFNAHFVRDIGCAFATVAAAYAWAALRPAYRVPLTALAAFFLVAHAALHVFDSLRGYLPAGHWQHDIAGVYLPALLAVGIPFLLAQRAPAPA